MTDPNGTMPPVDEPTLQQPGSEPEQQQPEDPGALVKRVMARLDGLVPRIEALEGPKPKGQPKGKSDTQQAGPAGVTHEDLIAATRLGERLAKLPESARTEVQERLEKGEPYSAVLQQVEFLAKHLPDPTAGPADGNAVGPTAPRGHGATPAPSPGGDLPRTKSEAIRIAQTDPARWAKIQQRTDFDIGSLPYA